MSNTIPYAFQKSPLTSRLYQTSMHTNHINFGDEKAWTMENGSRLVHPMKARRGNSGIGAVSR
jgi:hypothetical protein